MLLLSAVGLALVRSLGYLLIVMITIVGVRMLYVGIVGEPPALGQAGWSTAFSQHSPHRQCIVNGLFYLVRSGCAWRYLPRDDGPWSTVYHYVRQFRRDGTWEQVYARLRELVRQRAGREPTPSAAIIDSQSVKTHQGGPRGCDGRRRRQESVGAQTPCAG